MCGCGSTAGPASAAAAPYTAVQQFTAPLAPTQIGQVGSASAPLTSTAAGTTTAFSPAPSTAAALAQQVSGLLAALQQTAGIGAAAAPATPAAPAPAATTQQEHDTQLLQRSLNVLKASPTARQVVDQIRGKGTGLEVLSDEEFAAQGKSDAAGWYDPKQDKLFLRRSRLEKVAGGNVDAAMTMVHELTHAADFKAGIGQRYAATHVATPQATLQYTLAIEARAHIVEGRVRAELGVHGRSGETAADKGVAWAMQDGDPALVAAAGGSYEQVWQTLMASKGYNPAGMQVPPIVLT